MWILIMLACFFKFIMAKIKSPMNPSGHKDWTEKISNLHK
jgi:hypothetical protein